MRCPRCLENQEESLAFPANNVKLSPKIPEFYDSEGRKIQLKQVALEYGCTNGHLFKLGDATRITEEEEKQIANKNMPIVPVAVQLPQQ